MPATTKQVRRRVPLTGHRWYALQMSGTQVMTVGHKGRVVLPAETRRRYGFEPGQKLVVVDTDDGPVLMTHEKLLARVRAECAGSDLVSKLLAERREAARRERSR